MAQTQPPDKAVPPRFPPFRPTVFMSMPTDSSAPSTLQCSKCAASLPEDAQFCLKCGTAVRLPIQEIVKEPANAELAPKTSRRQPKRHYFRWVLLALILVTIIWAASSEDPYAQGVQELVGWKHDEAILDNSFSVSPRNFRYYKFSLPQASTNVTIVGQFTSSFADKGRKPSANDSENGLEVYVLSESAFAIWQKGYATGSVYESGRVDNATIRAELPAGAGVYYLIFSNKFSTKTTKAVDAEAVLRYKSWLPRWIHGLRTSVGDWLGL